MFTYNLDVFLTSDHRDSRRKFETFAYFQELHTAPGDLSGIKEQNPFS